MKRCQGRSCFYKEYLAVWPLKDPYCFPARKRLHSRASAECDKTQEGNFDSTVFHRGEEFPQSGGVSIDLIM